MTALLPWVAALSGAVLFLYRVGVLGKDLLDRLKAVWLPASVPIVLSLVGWGVGFRYADRFDGLGHLCLGALLGSIAALAVALAASEDKPKWNPLFAILFPAAALGATHWLPTPEAASMAQNGLAAGAAAMALMAGIGRAGALQASLLSSAAAAAVLALADRIGRATEIHAAAQTGLLLGLAAALGFCLSLCLFDRNDAPQTAFQKFAGTAVTCVLIVLGGYLAAQKLIGFADVTLIALGAVVLALFTHWLIEADRQNSLRFGVAAAIWVAAATLAFAERKSYGMAVMAASGALLLIALGSQRALLSMGPALGLVFYRLFRNDYPEASRALDLGQHYAIVGLLLGVLLALIAAQWFGAATAKMAGGGAWGGLVWMVLLAMVPLVAAVLLGPKGVAGYVVGLGLAAFVEGFRGEARLFPLATGAALAFLFIAGYGWIGNVDLLTRAEKTNVILRYALDIVGLAVILVLLSSEKRRSEP